MKKYPNSKSFQRFTTNLNINNNPNPNINTNNKEETNSTNSIKSNNSTTNPPTKTIAINQRGNRFTQKPRENKPTTPSLDSYKQARPNNLGTSSILTKNNNNNNNNFKKDKENKPRSITYCPRLHTAKTIKEWETKTGKNWYNLSPSSRNEANKEMNDMVKLTKKALEISNKAAN